MRLGDERIFGIMKHRVSRTQIKYSQTKAAHFCIELHASMGGQGTKEYPLKTIDLDSGSGDRMAVYGGGTSVAFLNTDGSPLLMAFSLCTCAASRAGSTFRSARSGSEAPQPAKAATAIRLVVAIAPQRPSASLLMLIAFHGSCQDWSIRENPASPHRLRLIKLRLRVRSRHRRSDRSYSAWHDSGWRPA